jgi:hypothetical protein
MVIREIMVHGNRIHKLKLHPETYSTSNYINVAINVIIVNWLN